MKTYKNLNGNSDVKAYQIYGDAIKIRFSDDAVYLYTDEKTGKEAIAKMKLLAVEGTGLSTYIQENISKDSAEKLP